MESGDESGSSGVEEKPAPTTETQTVDPDDFDTVEAERTDTLGRRRENSIPHSRVKAMIAKKERTIIANIAKELGISKAEAELKFEDITGALTEKNTKFTEIESRVNVADTVGAIMEQDDERFIRMLAQANPKYQRYLTVLDQPAVETKQQTVDDPEPEPDYDLGDGRKTYSLEGLKKRDEWKERQLERKFDKKLSDRFSPIEQERQVREKQQQDEARVREIHTTAEKAVARTIERASKWPQFTENEAEIAKALDANPSLELVDAYMQVVMPKFSTDRTTIRKELLAEINGQPKTTSLSTAATTAKTEKAKTTSDYAREVMSQLGSS